MKEKKSIRPPKWANRLLSWYCRPELVEDLEGDLNEYFERNVKSKGIRQARIIYSLDVIKFLRPYTIRKPELFNLLSHVVMINSYIKISRRSILRNKLFSSINIVGLAISMAVGLLLIALLSDMNQYDKFHEHHDRIYRVISNYKYLDQNDDYYASTSIRAAKAIQEDIPGIEKMTMLYRGFEGDMRSGEKKVPLSGHWADESFFSVFTFPMISGDPSTALKNPYSIVLTEESAKKLFGTVDVLGKSVFYPSNKDEKEFLITGIIKDVPFFSHMRFDMLASFSTRQITEKDNKQELAWDNIWNGYVYLLLPRETNFENFITNLNTISAREDQTVKNTTIKLSLQPMEEISLGEDLNNSIGPVMGSSNVWMIGVLATIVILSACFNYTNLSIARSMRRSREVGIRKVVGALRSHVVTQFVIEAVMIALLSLAFSFLLFGFLKPFFLSLNNQYRKMLLLNISPEVILYFILLAIGVGIVAGLSPAVFFSRVNAMHVLKNMAVVRGFRNVTMRKGLIVVQFTISLMFIAATIIGYKHYKRILAFDLGFDTENVLNIKLHGHKADLLKKELAEIPEIKKISSSSLITSLGNFSVTKMKYVDPSDSTLVNYNSVDENYLPLHGHNLLAGRNFTGKEKNSEESEVIVNEKVLKHFNIADQDPQKAVGEIVTVDAKKVQIVGVLKDFHYGKSTDKEIREVIFRYSAEAQYLNVKVISTDWPATFEKINLAWKKIDNVHPLEATFYDEEIERSYNDFSSRIKVIGSLAFLAICIASIGLLGMVVFTTETRLKEISIRKIMGASEGNLVLLLSKGFLVLMAIAALIALPVTHMFFTKYVFDEYADGAPIAWSELTVGMISVIAIAFIMIGSYTLKVARSNPAEVLKNE